jgi:hypothetical protein
MKICGGIDRLDISNDFEPLHKAYLLPRTELSLDSSSDVVPEARNTK